MYVNARVIIEHEPDQERMILVQVRNKPHLGGKWLELPGGRAEEFESLFSGLKQEVKEETGLEMIQIEGSTTRQELVQRDANVECLTPFAVYQMIRGPVDTMGVCFLCQARG